MATLEKLVKALEALKITKDPPPTIEDEAAVRRKKKLELFSFVAVTICSPSVKNASNFASLLSFCVETLLQLCDDPDSNIRMAADESLNRVIRAMMDSNAVKIHIELHKEIKKNGNVRSLRAALWRFGQLAHMIRPMKGKAYVQNLTPCLVEIAKRREEPVLETLAAALPPIMAALGSFTTDNNIRDLLKSFLANLSSDMTVARRTAATSIVSVCLHCRKPSVFLCYTLNTLIDKIIPLKDGDDGDTVLGVLNCVRLLLPHLTQANDPNDSGLHGSFGVRHSANDSSYSIDRFIQVYELCLHFTYHKDHNIVTTALETLHQLFVSAPTQLFDVLLSPDGLSRSRIQAHPHDTEKMSRRTLSELSVASTVDQSGTVSPLLDSQDDKLQDGRLAQWIQNSSSPSHVDSASEESDTEATAASQFVGVPPILVCPAIERAPSLEADALLGRDTPSPDAAAVTEPIVESKTWDIGQAVQTGCVAVLYCCRRLVTGFLLPDSEPGMRVRVSVRALALQCLTQLVRVHPALFYCSIDLNNQAADDGFSHVSDVLRLASHSDPQLRGLTCVLVGSFIQSALVTGSDSLMTLGAANVRSVDDLLSLLKSGLQDESSICVRHALTGVSTCLGPLLASCDHQAVLPVLPVLLSVSSNPYWLVKVKLLELLGELLYRNVYYVTGNCDFQTRVLHGIMLGLLADDDFRVRNAATLALSRLVTRMYYPGDESQWDAVHCSAAHLTDSLVTGLLDRNVDKGAPSGSEQALSRVVFHLTKLLLQSSSKHLTAGCCEALSMLSEDYPPSTYPHAWHCFLARPPGDAKTIPSVSGLLGTVVAMLTASPTALDLDIHHRLLTLAANLFAGLAPLLLRSNNEFIDKTENKPLWSHFSDPKMELLSELLLHHLMRLLCIFVRVLEDTPAPKHPLPLPSPIKRRPTRSTSPAKLNPAAGEKEASKEEKGKFGQFSHIPHYNKLYDNLRSAYASYKSQLECSDKVAGLLGAGLRGLCCLLDHSSWTESSRLVEELLVYLRVAVSLEPITTINTVQQLLKSLFGSNKIALWEEERESMKPSEASANAVTSQTFHESVLRRPFSHLNLPIATQDDLTLLQNKLKREMPNHRKTSSRGLSKMSDRHGLTSYIRLFEPLVIHALTQYTVTNNVSLQVAVLSLLIQLVQLKVNYCMLDSDQIFIEFVLKQFEFLEVGQIQQPQVLIPKIFEFLVQLSNEKNHSKLVISVAKVIQLCDGLMASGQDPVTHCIPALSPIVEHVFMTTSCHSDWQVKAQRDVVLSMLLRLAEYPSVLRLLSQVLSADRSGGEEVKRWSHQIADVVMPLLAQGRVRLDSPDAIAALLSLLASFLPRTLSPPDPVLRVLFTSQLYEVEYGSHSLGTMLAMLLYILGRDDEDSLLARLEDLKLCVREQSDDPLNASAANLNDPPHTVFARLLLRTLHSMTDQLLAAEFCNYSHHAASHLQFLLAHFLICCIQMFKSNSHQQITAGWLGLVTEADLTGLTEQFMRVRGRCPLPSLLWCQLLTVIGYSGKPFWTTVALFTGYNTSSKPSRKLCLNQEIVERGSLITFCEYIVSRPGLVEESAWLLSHLADLLLLYTEPPVSELLEVCRNNPVTSGLLLPSVATLCANNPPPRLVSRVLDYLVSVSLDDSGLVLTILSSLLHHPHLVLARRAAALASSRVEYLLILEREEVLKLFDQESLLYMLEILTKDNRFAAKHSGLVSLLNKLASTHFNMSPVSDQGRTINTANIHTIALDKPWFLTQVRLRCCQTDSAQQCSQLLSQLDYADIVTVLRCQQFNNYILQHCFTLGTQLTVQERNTLAAMEGEHLSAVYLAARAALLQHIHHLHTLLPRMHQVYSPVGRSAFPKESKYTDRLNELFGDAQFLETLFRLVPAVVSYLHSLDELSSIHQSLITPDTREDLAKFGVLCIEVVQWAIQRGRAAVWPGLVQGVLDCAISVLSHDQLAGLLTLTQLGSVMSALARLVHLATGNALTLRTHSGGSLNEYLADVNNLSLPLPPEGTDEDDEEESPEQEAVVNLHTRYQIAALVGWLEKPPELLTNVPQFILQSIRSIVKSVGRCSPVLWYSCTPPDTWPPSPPLQPPLPTPIGQDIDLLRQVIFRVSLFGWTSRTQFEETWMSLLAVLSSSPEPDADPDEVQAIMQSNSVAVQGITALLVQTLLKPCPGSPHTGRPLHSARDRPLTLPSQWGSKLERVTDALYWKLKESHKTVQSNVRLCRLHHRCNLDRLHSTHRYVYGQVSVDFLKTAVMSVEERAASTVNSDYMEYQQRIADSGLDLQSCVQFLLDLYSQWTRPEVGVSLSLLLEVVRSTLVVSDLFCERSHFAWLLELCLELSASHPSEDQLLHLYLVPAACKAAAVLPTLETEVCERVLRLLEDSLKSTFPPARVAALHGLIYLLQTFIFIQGEAPATDAANKVPDTRQRLLTMAREYIQRHFTTSVASVPSEESQLVLYSLVLYIMENAPNELPPEVQSHLLQLVISTSSSRQTVLYQALVQGLCRLVVTDTAGVLEPVTRLAVDRLTQSDPAVSLPALQLLLACMYAGEYSKVREEVDPEQMVATMEKTSVLFDRVKRGSPLEVECVCAVLPFLLADFFPASEVLTKVIGEFLSPQQPNHRHLSAVVFQVLSQACREDQLPLLQAWLVMSLHIFTQTLPVAMATWCLSCFFISASTNPWLRAIFPHVQSRMGKYTYEDRKLLCIAASDFYKQLSDSQQKETFLKTFKEAASTPRSPFADVIASL